MKAGRLERLTSPRYHPFRSHNATQIHPGARISTIAIERAHVEKRPRVEFRVTPTPYVPNRRADRYTTRVHHIDSQLVARFEIHSSHIILVKPYGGVVASVPKPGAGGW